MQKYDITDEDKRANMVDEDRRVKEKVWSMEIVEERKTKEGLL